MTYSDFRNFLFSELHDLYPEEEIHSFYGLLGEFYLKKNRFQMILNQNTIIEAEQVNAIKEAVEKLKHAEPIQYILSETEFFGLPFKVNAHTLIPRPETEELVSMILEDLQIKQENNPTGLKLIDIGTGSGCIAISLAYHLKNTSVSAIDVSDEALEVAEENASINEVDVEFISLDILNSELPEVYDVIVSNPPYVRNSEKNLMQANVINYEPHLALFVEDDNPLLFYLRIAQLATVFLQKNGMLYFEINEFLGPELKLELEDLGFTSVEVIQDIYGKDRFIKGKKL